MEKQNLTENNEIKEMVNSLQGITKVFNPAQIYELCAGLKEGVDILEYADSSLNFNKMREKRHELSNVNKDYIVFDNSEVTRIEPRDNNLSYSTNTIKISYRTIDEIIRYNNSCFVENDIAYLMDKLNIDKRIIFINQYADLEEKGDKFTRLKKVLDALNNDPEFKDSIILINSYVSCTEYPREEYYLNESEKDDNKKLLPLNDILKEYEEKFVNLGFVNINNLVEYEYQEAFMYNNEAAKEVLEYIEKNYN